MASWVALDWELLRPKRPVQVEGSTDQSQCGKQSQSMEPSMPTSAAVRRLPMIP
jgi:hypothetical protein